MTLSQIETLKLTNEVLPFRPVIVFSAHLDSDAGVSRKASRARPEPVRSRAMTIASAFGRPRWSETWISPSFNQTRSKSMRESSLNCESLLMNARFQLEDYEKLNLNKSVVGMTYQLPVASGVTMNT